MMKKAVAVIGTNGLPGRYGGWDQLMNHLTENLRSDYQFIVYTSSHNAVPGLKEVNGAQLKIIRLKANGWQSVPYDIISLLHAAIKYDILLVLGTSGCIVLPIIRLFKKKIILNPDGAEWKRGKWSKPVQAFLKLSERFGVKFSDIIIADNKIIQDYLLETYAKESRLIPYGGDNAKYVPMSIETKSTYGIEEKQYAFKVCRIEPENNIDLILQAFSTTDMTFIIIGNWNFSEYGINLREQYKGTQNLILLDPIYNQSQLDELRGNCSIYIHGHSVGGTNPSLVEAMNLGLFCVVYDVDYNRETTGNEALYFKTSDDLRKIVLELKQHTIPTEIYREKMAKIAKRRYKWEIITAEYSKTFG